MRILITNDDGIRAQGIETLARVAANLGEVAVVAPDRERSACSHSMTMRDPLRVHEISYPVGRAFEVHGTPTDCVNIGLRVAWEDGCDLVLSGINHGANLGWDVTYSGTAAAAMEGCIQGIRSVSLSLAAFTDSPYLWSEAETFLNEYLGKIVALDVPPRTFLNVNIPNLPADQIKGIIAAEMGHRVYEDRMEQRTDPWGRHYYWQGGINIVQQDLPGSDAAVIRNGYASVTPISLNWTDPEMLSLLQNDSRFALPLNQS